MNLAIVFPNEDSFYRRMGIEIYENFESFQNLLKRAEKYSRMKLKDVLIYENCDYDWDIVSKRVAVLLTSIGFYQIWKEIYQTECDTLIGYGTGYLAALVCEGVLKEQDAISMLQKKKVNSGAVVETASSKTICLSKGRLPQSKQDILEEIEYCLWNTPDDRKWNEIIQKMDGKLLLEIGPDHKLSDRLQNVSCGAFTWLDREGDSAYILENFQMKKFFNRQYGVRRLLAVIASTQNYNPEEESQEKILECYSAVKKVLDVSLQGGGTKISDDDWNLCVEKVKENFAIKRTTKDEIKKRLEKLEKETFIEFQESFKDTVN
ncbi:ACP S-malonyltransferase [Anaeromicropila populeti]|uniref:[acyl-carrier-protein] S-malonyltransferase n=1 Tax=Anaeromicropila populeti TaxID=37658 RepID=A0A1I6LZ73_9FIRM|nr:hypothetical protein [Anaeromicropila populeti]SFS08582.1 hypothetical protein SAMN05661086_03674 [Anaeromicropila populeti]